MTVLQESIHGEYKGHLFTIIPGESSRRGWEKFVKSIVIIALIYLSLRTFI
jgi:hypothetical protein